MDSGAMAPSLATATHRGRNGALLFGAASLVTLLGLLLPHQSEVDTLGLEAVVVGTAILASVLVLAQGRLPEGAYSAIIAIGTVMVSVAVYSNGERRGGPAGYDELYYLWVVFYAAHYLRRRSLVLQVLLIAVSYGITLALMDLGAIATSRWLTVIGLVTGGAIVVRLLTEHVEQLVTELDAAARTDRLTGLANRRALEEEYRREAARAGRTGEPLALVLIDLNRFKDVNDLYGHAAGDAVLTSVAQSMQRVIRDTDVAARIGGDEFALLLPNVNMPAATAIAHRLTKLAADQQDPATRVGLSFGVAVSENGFESLETLSRDADKVLYINKRSHAPRPISALTPFAMPR
jgi:diguanylate cyclase (GGDEF)-like protein